MKPAKMAGQRAQMTLATVAAKASNAPIPTRVSSAPTVAPRWPRCSSGGTTPVPRQRSNIRYVSHKVKRKLPRAPSPAASSDDTGAERRPRTSWQTERFPAPVSRQGAGGGKWTPG